MHSRVLSTRNLNAYQSKQSGDQQSNYCCCCSYSQAVGFSVKSVIVVEFVVVAKNKASHAQQENMATMVVTLLNEHDKDLHGIYIFCCET